MLGPSETEVVEEVESFCYLGSIVDRAVRAMMVTAWSKRQDISNLLRNRWIPLKNRAQINRACIRKVLLYGAESWPLTQRLENCIQSCDRRMMRFMGGVSRHNRVSSSEVARRCGLKEISDIACVRRLQLFDHVQRRGEGEPLSVVRSWQVEGPRPRGRPKSWMRIIEEDMRLLGINEALANDCQS